MTQTHDFKVGDRVHVLSDVWESRENKVGTLIEILPSEDFVFNHQVEFEDKPGIVFLYKASELELAPTKPEFKPEFKPGSKAVVVEAGDENHVRDGEIVTVIGPIGENLVEVTNSDGRKTLLYWWRLAPVDDKVVVTGASNYVSGDEPEFQDGQEVWVRGTVYSYSRVSGTYSIDFADEGDPESLIIDDLPPAYVRGDNEGIWVL